MRKRDFFFTNPTSTSVFQSASRTFVRGVRYFFFLAMVSAPPLPDLMVQTVSSPPFPRDTELFFPLVSAMIGGRGLGQGLPVALLTSLTFPSILNLPLYTH